MVTEGTFEMAPDFVAANAKLSPEFAGLVARAAVDAKHSREAAEGAAAAVPAWRFRLRRKAARAVERHLSQEQRLLAILGGRAPQPPESTPSSS